MSVCGRKIGDAPTSASPFRLDQTPLRRGTAAKARAALSGGRHITDDADPPLRDGRPARRLTGGHVGRGRRLGKGLSIRETAAATGKGVSTVQRVKAAMEQ